MKNNKLLSEYLGEKVKEFTWKDTTVLVPEDCDPIIDWDDDKIWQPNSDWNQLMLVVDKIEEDGLTWTMEHKRRYVQDKNVYFFRIWDDEDDNPVVNVNKFQRIEAVYNACVEYITIKNEIK
jgi:hypothetical protein